MFFCSKIEKSKNFENSHENTQKTSYKMSLSSCEIREQITPKGDGNIPLFSLIKFLILD